MNQAEYEHMMKVYSYISSSPPDTLEREKRLAEISKEDNERLKEILLLDDRYSPVIQRELELGGSYDK